MARMLGNNESAFESAGRQFWVVDAKVRIGTCWPQILYHLCIVFFKLYFLFPNIFIAKKNSHHPACQLYISAQLRGHKLQVYYFISMSIRFAQFLFMKQLSLLARYCKTAVIDLDNLVEALRIFFSCCSCTLNFKNG